MVMGLGGMIGDGFVSLFVSLATGFSSEGAGLVVVSPPDSAWRVETPIKAAIALPSFVTTYKLSGSSDEATVSKISENRFDTSSWGKN